MSRATGRHTRPKKLTPKQNVHIFREEQVDAINDIDAVRNQVETGVEKAEESEYHLQQAIKASQVLKQDQKIKDAYIPTPPTISSDIQYDVLYPKGWQQPNTYIRSSATVEDCNPISYCMDEEDELNLKLINGKLSGQPPISEDQFEEVMSFFEETVSIEQPFASVSAEVMSLEELLQHTTESTPDAVRTYAKPIYEHWSARRAAKGNSALPPQLLFESGKESDDADPYVCFRRREIRQTRKTRHRDLQSAEKLRKLRFELEQARDLLRMVKQREQARKDQLEIDKQVFEQRQAFRELKRKLKQTGDDDLLITQKKQKLAPPMPPPDQQLGQQLVSARPGPELKTIEDLRAERQRAIESEIQLNVEKHIRWNEGYVDKTTFPLSPEKDRAFRDVDAQFLPAVPATYLPTPPASISEDEAIAEKPTDDGDVEMKDISRSSTPFRYATPDDEDEDKPQPPAFRRRIGRGGRILVDRRFAFRSKQDRGPDDDRFKYDRDSENEDDEDTLFDGSHMGQTTRQSNERSLLMARSSADTQAANARRAQIEQANAGHAPVQPPQAQIAAGGS
ncbi:Enhancer of polycomb-like protein 1 [Knufia fluminis]|uniref:Enhancer of polycomb-like protein n=1 Tax=Knufia fluminis TaxID=191047 RepID=A0AAN8I5L9_9EURO|nr:Enhancer of polycomb-like protein 1 [Knufia fluminis]